MIITTAQNAKFDTLKPARSNIIMVLDQNGNKKMDDLRITGKTTTITEFGESKSMIEVEHSFGVDELNEDFIWQ